MDMGLDGPVHRLPRSDDLRPQRKQKALRNNPLGLSLRGSDRRAAELVEHPGADVAVPLVVARRDLDDPRVQKLYCTPMDAFDFERGARMWDLIWIQWVAIYLPDREFVAFFRKAIAALKPVPHARVVLKENVLKSDADPPVPDLDDSSVTRSDAHLRRLWAEAGVTVHSAERQTNMPEELYPIIMYVLGPAD